MLDQYFSKVEDQERMKKTLLEVSQPDCGGKLLLFRGAVGSGKSIFYLALAKAVAKKTDGKRTVQQSDLSETVNWRFGMAAFASTVKEETETIFVLETNDTSPYEINDDMGFRRRVVDLHFDQAFDAGAQNDDKIVDALSSHLLSLMA